VSAYQVREIEEARETCNLKNLKDSLEGSWEKLQKILEGG